MEGYSYNEMQVYRLRFWSGFSLQGIGLSGGLFWTWLHTQTEQGTVIYGSLVSSAASTDKAPCLLQQEIIVLSSEAQHNQ